MSKGVIFYLLFEIKKNLDKNIHIHQSTHTATNRYTHTSPIKTHTSMLRKFRLPGSQVNPILAILL